MTWCPICHDRGEVACPKSPGGVDACPHCAQLAEVAYQVELLRREEETP